MYIFWSVEINNYNSSLKVRCVQQWKFKVYVRSKVNFSITSNSKNQYTEKDTAQCAVFLCITYEPYNCIYMMQKNTGAYNVHNMSSCL